MAEATQPTKACPYCGEQILAVAIKCKHCGERLDMPVSPAQPKPTMATAKQDVPSVRTMPMRSWKTALAFWVVALLGTLFLDVGLYRNHVNGRGDNVAYLIHVFLLCPVFSIFTGLIPGLIARSLFRRCSQAGGMSTKLFFGGFVLVYVVAFYLFWSAIMNGLWGVYVNDPLALIGVLAVVAGVGLAVAVWATPREAAMSSS